MSIDDDQYSSKIANAARSVNSLFNAISGHIRPNRLAPSVHRNLNKMLNTFYYVPVAQISGNNSTKSLERVQSAPNQLEQAITKLPYSIRKNVTNLLGSTTRSFTNQIGFRQTNEAAETSSSKAGYIFAFVFIFLIVLFGIVGRVIYSANESSSNLAYLKYHRASAAAAALNDTCIENGTRGKAGKNAT
jgi:Na+/proline symporter